MEFYTIPIEGPNGAGKMIIYRPLAGLAFVGNKAMADLTLQLVNNGSEKGEPNEPVEFLQTIGFLEPDPFPPPLPGGNFCPTTAVLLLTNQCQLRCTYCYASAGTLKASELSPELGKAAITHVYENAQELGRSRFEVIFHGGGEPTMAWKTLQECVNYARQRSLPANISLTSNGIWSPQKSEWLMDHLDQISLSMDGNPQTQNHYRPYSNGRGSSDAVMRTIAALDRRDFKYGLRMTAAAPWGDFPRNVRFLCEETKVRSMQVEPAYNIQRGGHAQPTINEARGFGEAFLEAYEIAAQAGRRLSFSGARLGKVTSMFCTAPYQALIVNANGDLVSCYEVVGNDHPLARLSIVGRIEDGKVNVDKSARLRLHQKMADRRAACRECACYWSCAGDCYTRTFMPEENGHMQYGARCELNRYLLVEMLLREIAKGDGVWRATSMRSQMPTLEAITI